MTADGELLQHSDNLEKNGYTIKSLAAGDYLVSIRHDGKTSIAVRGDDPQQVADDGALNYAGSWRTVTSAKDVGGSIHLADSGGATVTHRFNGNQVRLIGRADRSGGLADIYLDGVRQLALIDCWISAAAMHRQVLYYRNGLADGDHELKIVVRGEKNPVLMAGACMSTPSSRRLPRPSRTMAPGMVPGKLSG